MCIRDRRLRYPGTRYFFEACLEAANDAESGEEGQKMREFFARLDAWRARLHTMGSVSYTHRDVYKRQGPS